MTQRRTPSGQGPTRRPGLTGRTGGSRGGVSRGASSRLTGRDSAVRGEPRRTSIATRAGDPTRSANRPAVARRTASGGAAKRTTAPRPRRLTGRATVLLVILTALVLGYTYPVRVYLDQRSDIAHMQTAQRDQRERIEDLREEVAKWNDDEYVRIQVRRRFYFAKPGEILLIPVWTDEEASSDEPASAGTPEQPKQPWYDTLWSSVEAANEESGR